jgi:uncharacterized protein DUF6883
MIIPKDATIAEEKIRDYLLKPQRKSDKSKYLSLAGYSREEFWELIRDLREQLLPGEGIFQERIEEGDLYVLLGILRGPNGRELPIKTIWLLTWQSDWKFVTLFPYRKAKR